MHKTSPELAQPAVPEGGNLNAAQMAKRALSWLETNEEIFHVMGCTEELIVTYSAFLLKDRAKDWLEQGSLSVAEYEKKFSDLIRAVPFIADNEEQKANSRNEVGQAASREDPVRQQRQGVRFHGPIARDRAQGCSLVRLPLSRPQVLEALETVGGASQRAISSETTLMWGSAVDQKTDLKYQGIIAEAEDSREVEPSPEDPVAPVSPVGALVGVGHLEDSPVDYMLRPVYSQSPKRRLMLP
ncbi:hypothetical protein JRO89_XS14G0157500 [Xanthoceras sorbifolium]|uniref:Retrotransposon gag domain-containing protein n=1 Tax=Xanthoceras sorbifolium TaxID=99658 RepID=A0ABQ8H5D5_9ROSI|nr:hypothetical protein JRO89_XS14G0157500 [Xanthoceras sorbifolium]